MSRSFISRRIKEFLIILLTFFFFLMNKADDGREGAGWFRLGLVLSATKHRTGMSPGQRITGACLSSSGGVWRAGRVCVRLGCV
jgi:hypothetical protein